MAAIICFCENILTSFDQTLEQIRLLSMSHLTHIDDHPENFVDVTETGQLEEGGLSKKFPLDLSSLLTSLPDDSSLRFTLILEIGRNVPLEDTEDTLQHLPNVYEYEAL